MSYQLPNTSIGTDWKSWEKMISLGICMKEMIAIKLKCLAKFPKTQILFLFLQLLMIQIVALLLGPLHVICHILPEDPLLDKSISMLLTWRLIHTITNLWLEPHYMKCSMHLVLPVGNTDISKMKMVTDSIKLLIHLLTMLELPTVVLLPLKLLNMHKNTLVVILLTMSH